MNIASGKITLLEVKKYLRADDYEDDDDYIKDLINISDVYIDKAVGDAYKSNSKYDKISMLVQKKLIKDMYDERSMLVTDKSAQSTIVTTIFEILEGAQWDT
jgi:uncharacterized phage protein (predicted DNA packaging)